jgi:hypothetical protein
MSHFQQSIIICLILIVTLEEKMVYINKTTKTQKKNSAIATRFNEK